MTANVVIDRELIEKWLDNTPLDQPLTKQQRETFIELATQCGLNPFLRELYITFSTKSSKDSRGQWTKTKVPSFVTGYQVYIDRAAKSGQLDGWAPKAVYNDKNELIGAHITIWRKDFRYPFEWDVSLKEFAKTDATGALLSTWKSMPEFMVKKTAIGQGFRLAFPNELGGMPYLEEEIRSSEPTETEIAVAEGKHTIVGSIENLGAPKVSIPPMEAAKSARRVKDKGPAIVKDATVLPLDAPTVDLTTLGLEGQMTITDAVKEIALPETPRVQITRNETHVVKPETVKVNTETGEVSPFEDDVDEWANVDSQQVDPKDLEVMTEDECRALYFAFKAKGHDTKDWNALMAQLGTTSKNITYGLKKQIELKNGL